MTPLHISYYSKWEQGRKIDWASQPRAPISHYRWVDNGYEPHAYGQLVALPDRLAVRLWAEEKELKCEKTIPNTQVCQDSCLEFFVNFSPKTGVQYLNFEINPNGTLLLGFGGMNPNRVLVDIVDPKDTFSIMPTIEPGCSWNVEFSIPYTFIKQYQRDFAAEDMQVISGNFFKCGGVHRHYGMWSPVELPVVNFHRSEFFAPIIFEEING